MKTLLIIWTCLCTGLCMAQAPKSDGTHVTVHAGENALETLLTEEQKQSVKSELRQLKTEHSEKAKVPVSKEQAR